MSYTTDVPTGVTNAGQDFNYGLWPANTTIRLGNVPWNSDYRDIVKFDSIKDLRDYVSRDGSTNVVINNMSYARFGQPINIPIAFNKANVYNYILATNNPYGDETTKQYAYFITHMEHVAPGTTRIYVQLDVWQTFGAYVKLGRAYVERGHVGIANSLASEDNGRRYLTVPEGLDLGDEYLSSSPTRTKIGENARGPGDKYDDASIIVVSSVSFLNSGGDVNNPVLKSATGNTINGIPSGADVYYFESPAEFTAFLSDYADKPWITQGIMAAYMVPSIATENVEGSALGTYGKKITSYPRASRFNARSNWRADMLAALPIRYRTLTKFLTYPYSFIEGTMYNGTPLVIKPQSLPLSNAVDSNLKMVLAQVITPPNPRIMIFPQDYNAVFGSADPTASNMVMNGEWLDFATGITNLPQIAVVNNMYANYLSTNKNYLEFQHRSADWSQTRAMAGANVQAGQATSSIGMNTEMNRLSVNAVNSSTSLANQTAGYNAIQSGVNGMVSQGTKGMGRSGMGGAAIGVAGAGANAAVGYGIAVNQNVQSASIQNQLSTGRTSATNAQAAYMRDTNLGFAEMASQGDYQNAIAGINARVQDAAMIQPTISGQSGGDAFNYSIHTGYEFVTKVKTLPPNAMTMIGEFWLRYGYAVNRFYNIGDNLLVMSNFTYWKVKELYLSSSVCPESFRQTIRGIFEKGVTVWKDPRDIATLDVGDNVAKTGITLL